jgi:N5-methyltetrahydromethanopterin:coenzyme M methyltransferase subunit C
LEQRIEEKMAEEQSTKNIFRIMNLDSTNVIAAAGVLSIVLIMVMPVPPIALDLLLAFNMTASLLVLLLSLYILRPLDFPIFPSLLLVTTLFRLSLNIASTRLILLHGHEGIDAAGKIIMGFGQFAVGGNFVVGAIIFFILIIINFVVITKGAGRIAEVAARFTLDAMPGKQMAIDADLNAGLIDEKTARQRRKEIAREAEFYGAMDGASKFVRGEAIAGIIILLINVIGGFIIGVFANKILKMNIPVMVQSMTEIAVSGTLLIIGLSVAMTGTFMFDVVLSKVIATGYIAVIYIAGGMAMLHPFNANLGPDEKQDRTLYTALEKGGISVLVAGIVALVALNPSAGLVTILVGIFTWYIGFTGFYARVKRDAYMVVGTGLLPSEEELE